MWKIKTTIQTGGIKTLALVLGTLFALSVAFVGCSDGSDSGGGSSGGGTEQGGGENPGGSGGGQETPSENQVTVTFSLDGGTWQDTTKQSAQTITKGTKVTLPTVPIKTGNAEKSYEFAGWYSDSSFNTPFNFDTAINENTTIYAKWNSLDIKNVTLEDITDTDFSPKTNTKYKFSSITNSNDITTIANKFKDLRVGSNVALDFSKCTSLNSIPTNAFKDLEGISSVYLPPRVTEIPEGAFMGCKSLSSVNTENITKYGKNAFNGCEALASVTISNTLQDTEIAEGVFNGCKNLVGTITLPDTVLTIKANAFNGCAKLENIGNMQTLTTIESGAFTGCTALKDCNIPKIATLPDNTFADCKNLVTVVVTADVFNKIKGVLQDADFSGNNTLETLKITGNLTEIATKQFKKFKAIKTLELPASITTVADDAFQIFSTKLENLSVNNKVFEKLPRDSHGYFSIYPELKTLKVTGDIGLGYNFNKNNPKLESITTVENNYRHSSEDGVLFNYNKTKIYCYPPAKEGTSYTIPDSVTEIGDSAFEGCTALTSVTIPESVTKIESSAFEGCTSLAYITIPDSVTKIGYEAFSGCTGLTSVTIPDSVTTIGYYAFHYWTNTQTITVAWAEGDKPSGWDEDWNYGCNAEIIYNGGK